MTVKKHVSDRGTAAARGAGAGARGLRRRATEASTGGGGGERRSLQDRLLGRPQRRLLVLRHADPAGRRVRHRRDQRGRRHQRHEARAQYKDNKNDKALADPDDAGAHQLRHPVHGRHHGGQRHRHQPAGAGTRRSRPTPATARRPTCPRTTASSRSSTSWATTCRAPRWPTTATPSWAIETAYLLRSPGRRLLGQPAAPTSPTSSRSSAAASSAPPTTSSAPATSPPRSPRSRTPTPSRT